MGLILGHIESGRRSIKLILPIYLTENHPSNEDDRIELPAVIFYVDDNYEGRSRFSLAKDGPRDCVALLMNETFLGKSQDLFKEYRDLGLLEGSLYLTRKETSQQANSNAR